MSRVGAAQAALFLLLLLLPPAGAASGAPLAATLEVAGAASAQGTVQLLDTAGFSPSAEARLSAPSWTVLTTSVGGLTVPGAATVRTREPRTVMDTWHGDLRAVPWASDARLFVAAVPGTAPRLDATFESARVAPPAADCVARPIHFLGHQPGPCVPLREAHAVASADGALLLHWTGPIQVQLWSWNVTGAGTAWSGSVHAYRDARLPVSDESDQVITLVAQDADVWFTLPGDGTALALLESTWDVTGTLVLQDALAGSVTQSTGAHAFRLDPRGGGAAIPIHSAPIPLPAGAAPATASPAGLGAAAAVLAGASGAAALAWRRSRPSDFLDGPTADELADEARAADAAGGPQAGQQAAILRTIAFIRSRQPDQAEAVLEAQHGAQPLDKADHAFLLACIRALQGRAEEAAAAVRACLAAAPSYAAEVRGTPILRAFLDAGPAEEGYA